MRFPRRPTLIVAGSILAVLVGLGGWLAFGGDDGTALWSDGSGQRVAEAPAGDEGAGPAEDAGSGDEAGSASSAPPRVHAFAEQPGADRAGPKPSPTAPQQVSEGIAGCDFAYGDGAICVPWQFPNEVTDKCAWLKARDYKPVKVNGRDRHNLDRNGDGVGCGPGD